MKAITDSDRIAMCKVCTLAECMKLCKLCPFNIGLEQIVKKDTMDESRIIKSFEHGDTFITLESLRGVYTVNLYLDRIASQGMSVTPSNSFSSTTLDAALEIYSDTCKHCVELSGV